MNTPNTFSGAGRLCLLLSAFCFPLSIFAQTTAFTYQGRLNDGAAPASGLYDLRFALFDADSGGAQQGNTRTNEATIVSNGLFTVTLSFGDVPFNGNDRWLEIGVRTNGGGAFVTLSPRQQITSTPYAIQAANAASAEYLSGTIATAQLTGTIAPTNIGAGTISTAMLADGAVTSDKIGGVLLAAQIPDLDAAKITSGTLADARLSASVSLLGPAIDSGEITDGTIANADISAGAAIADTKLATISTAGKVADSALSANVAQLSRSPQTFTGATNVFNGRVGIGTASPASALAVNGTVTASVFDGSGAALTSLNADKLTSGTVLDARLSANVALLDRSAQTFAGTNVFAQPVGIGAAASGSTLRVQGAGALGNVWVSPSTSGGNADIFLSENTSGSFGIILRHNGASNTLDFVGVNSSVETSNPVVSIGRGNTSGMHVRSDLTVGDSLGIGTNIPSAKLHIGGTPGTDGIKFPDGSVQVRAAKVIRYTTSTAWPIQSLAPGAATSYSFSVAGAQVGSAVVVTPLSDLGPAIAISQAQVWSANNVRFYVQNISTLPYDAPDTYFTIAVFE